MKPLNNFIYFWMCCYTALPHKAWSPCSSTTVSKWWKTIPLSDNINRRASTTDAEKAVGGECIWCLGTTSTAETSSVVCTKKQWCDKSRKKKVDSNLYLVDKICFKINSCKINNELRQQSKEYQIIVTTLKTILQT